MTSAYASWNEAIGRFFLNPDQAEARVVFAADAETLLEIARGDDRLPTTDDPEQAAASLVMAVRDEARAHGWTLGRLEPDRHPHCLAMIAVFVLAVFRMETTEGVTLNAYWYQLESLLEPSVEPRPPRSTPPCGLKPGRFGELWRRGLEGWANRIQQGRWGRVELPAARSGPSHLVRLPKSQALMRKADLDALPRFFSRFGLRPEDPPAKLRRMVALHRGSSRFFTAHAQRVLADEHREPLAQRQIAEALKAWDGQTEYVPLPRSRERRWLRLDDELAQIEGVRVRADGARMSAELSELLVPLPSHGVLLTVWDDFEEVFEEVSGARAGDRVLLLGPMLIARGLHAAAARVTEPGELRAWGPPDFPELEGLPAGWAALCCVLTVHGFGDRLGPWAPLLRRGVPAFQLEGGLPLGRNSWMAGAGPTLVLTDPGCGQVTIDGRPFPVVDGRVGPGGAPVLDEPGCHEVRVGDALVEIRVVVPDLVAPSTRSDGVDGAWIGGEWEARARRDLERRWLEAACAIRDGTAHREPGRHPLLRQLQALSAVRCRDLRTT